MVKDKNIELFNKLTKNINSVSECMVEMKNDPILFMKLMNSANYLDDYDNINESTIDNNIYNKIKTNTKKYGVNYHKVISNIYNNIMENNNKNNKEANHQTNINHIIWIYTSSPSEALVKLCKDKGIILNYINTNDCQYKIKDNDSIIIKSNNKTININKNDNNNKSVLVICRKGYNNDNINVLLNLFIDYKLLVVNNPESVEICSNKYKTAKLLSENDIPQPNYILVTPNDIHKTDNKEFESKLKTIYNKLDDELIYICKILSGHGGAGVFKCRGKNILSILQCLYKLSSNTEILVQEYKETDGDIRVNVLTIGNNQKILNVVKRNKIDGDFRSNLSLGGETEEYELSDEQKELALKTAKLSGLTWAGIDLLAYRKEDRKDKENKSNKIYTDIIEINAAPGTMCEHSSDKETKNSHDYKFWENLIDNI